MTDESRVPLQGHSGGPLPPHYPMRGDDVEAWLRRHRNVYAANATIVERAAYEVLDRLLESYRECSDYGLSLRPEDDERGDQ